MAIENDFEIVDLETLEPAAAVSMSYLMLMENFPKTYKFMKNKNPKNLEEFKNELFKIDKKTLPQETGRYIMLLRMFSMQNPDLMEDYNMMNLDANTPQAIFNRYKSASWVLNTMKQQTEEIKKGRKGMM